MHMEMLSELIRSAKSASVSGPFNWRSEPKNDLVPEAINVNGGGIYQAGAKCGQSPSIMSSSSLEYIFRPLHSYLYTAISLHTLYLLKMYTPDIHPLEEKSSSL